MRNFRKYLLYISIILTTWSCKDRAEIREIEEIPPQIVDSTSTISLMFGGDLMFHQPQIDGAMKADSTFCFKKCFEPIAKRWEGCDFVIFNLETTLLDSNFSGYPRFGAPKSIAKDLKELGVTHLALANNHSADKGTRGIVSTINYCKEQGISTVGTYIDTTSRHLDSPHYLEKEGFKVALLNYTYSTNGIPVPRGLVVNMIDTVQISEDILKARRGFATNIIVFVHWGNEYSLQPSKEQRFLSGWLHSRGVDLVIGSHPHVVQPIEYSISEGLTVYSMGNFISNQRRRGSDGGILVKVVIRRNIFSGECEYAYEVYPHYVYRAKVGDRPRYYCLGEGSIADFAEKGEDVRLSGIFFEDVRKIEGIGR